MFVGKSAVYCLLTGFTESVLWIRFTYKIWLADHDLAIFGFSNMNLHLRWIYNPIKEISKIK
ncbi:hypothetical protein HQ40_05040 [Porphyromonas gulae]|nr:hypothetical protein HQ40_05040 [Porphyromonas gulae]